MSAHQLSKEQWLQYIQSWRTSGLSQSDWCRKNGVKHSQFWYWKRKLANASQSDADAHQKGNTSPAFVPVMLEQPTEPVKPVSHGLTVSLPNGLMVTGFDHQPGSGQTADRMPPMTAPVIRPSTAIPRVYLYREPIDFVITSAVTSTDPGFDEENVTLTGSLLWY